MFTKSQYEEYENKYKDKINALAREFDKDIVNAMEIFYKKYQKENGNVVIAAIHKSLCLLFGSSCHVLVKAAENKEMAVTAISKQIDSIKKEVEEERNVHETD